MPKTLPGLPDIESLYDAAACGLALTTAAGVIQRVNATFCRWAGFEPAELVGERKLQDLLTMGGRIFFQTHWSPLLQMQGSVAEVKIEIRRKDGKTVPMLMNAIRREHAGSVFHELAFFVTIDRHAYERELISARRKADELLVKEQQATHALILEQARLRVALSSAGLFVWEVDVVTGERRYEDQVALLLGHDAPKPISATDFALAIDSDDREVEAERFAQAMQDKQEYSCTFKLDRVDGKKSVVSSTGRGVFDAQGALIHFVGVLQDITESVSLRAASEDRALFSEQMVGIVSHDLRNPLAAIKMSCMVLARSELSEQQREVLQRIDESVSRARRLVSDLLDFTQTRVGRGLSVSLKPVDLEQVILAAVAELKIVFRRRALTYESQGRPTCVADPDRLTQILGNLVGNAMAYGDPSRPVRISSRTQGEWIVLSVHNEGSPIPPELMSRIFDPLTRGQHVQEGPRGVGLGLYIVSQIAKAHGGHVSVSSSHDAGTTFTVRVPAECQG